MVHRAVWKRPAEEPGEQASPAGDGKRRALPPAAQCAAEHGSAVQCPFAAPGAAPLLLTAPDSDEWHSSNSPAAEALMNTDPRELMRAARPPADFSGDLEFLKKISKLTPRHDTSLPYLDERQKIVKFIICVCEGLKLQAVTAHRSVNYFDRLLHGAREISRAVLKLFATASILIAAKFEEHPTHCPSVGQLSAYCEGCSKERLVAAESLLLSKLGWNALSATMLHFLQCYLNLGVHCESDTLNARPITVRDKIIIEKKIETVATLICLQDYSFSQFELALVACACVCAVRRICNISRDVWPDELVTRLGYSLEDLSECVGRILRAADLSSQISQALAADNPEPRLGQPGAEKGKRKEGSPRSVTEMTSYFSQRS